MHMKTHIQIRNVPQNLHRKLKIRAAEKDVSLSDYIRKLLEADIAKPTLSEMTERLKALPPVQTVQDSAEIIRELRDSH